MPLGHLHGCVAEAASDSDRRLSACVRSAQSGGATRQRVRLGGLWTTCHLSARVQRHRRGRVIVILDRSVSSPAPAREPSAFVLRSWTARSLCSSRRQFSSTSRSCGHTSSAGDDWRLFQRGSTPGDYFKPFNGHLSVVPIGIYRLLLEIFGLGSALPLRLVALASLAAVAITMYFVVRSRVGPALGLVAAGEMLWSATLPLAPATFNHWLALAAVIFCSWPLTRESPSGDIALGLALAFALCSSGVGVAGAAACLGYTALSRAPLRRWLVVIGPTAAWAAWWLLASGERSRSSRSATESLGYLRHGVSASFRALAFGNRNLGILLVALFAANLIWRLRKGPRNARHELSWCAALLAWWLGLAYSREGTDALVFRYELVGSAFVILGALPAHRPTWAGRKMNSRGVVAAAIVVAGLLVYENHNAIFGDADRLSRNGAEVRQQLVVANLGRDIVPDSTRLPLVRAPVGVYRALTHEFGTPDGTSTTHPDARIVALGAIRPIETSRRPVGRCVPVGFSYLLPPTSTTRLRAESGDVHVRLRRFGRDWVSIGVIRDGTTSLIDLPGLQASKPWILQAPGACLVRDAPTSAIVRPEDKAELTGSTQLVAVTRNVYATPRRIPPVRVRPERHTNRQRGTGLRLDPPMGFDVGTKWRIRVDECCRRLRGQPRLE